MLSNLWSQETADLVLNFGENRLIPINKAYPSITEKDYFRSIIVQSPIMKWQELRFLHKIQKFCEKHIIKEQFGFIRGVGTQPQILKLITDLQKFCKKDQRVVIFIDFRSAYNCADMTILFNFFNIMHVLNKEETIFLRNLMSWQYVQYDKQKIAFKNGVPQGSVLSPFLFDIYTHVFIIKLEQNFDSSKIDHFYLYADDLAFICKEQNIEQLLNCLQSASREMNLHINIKKCVLIKICKTIQRKQQIQDKLRVAMALIFRILTNTLVQKQMVKKKIRYIEFQVSRLSRKFTQGNQFLLWNIYVRPQIQYIFPLMYTQNKSCRKIEQLWKQSLKMIMELPKSTKDKFLQLIQGNCQDLAMEQQGLEIIEEEAGKSKKHLENFGVMNLSNNIRRLFMLNLRMCKEHTNWRCGIKHLNQVRSINIYDIIDCALKQRAWANIKKETECRIQEILEKYEGDYMEQ